MFAFGLSPPPKLVIQFTQSAIVSHPVGKPGYYAHWDKLQLSRDFGRSYGCACGSYEDVVEQDKRIYTFMRECLVPLCVETNALVLLALDSCALSKAFIFACLHL
jgi:hypothetical protein